MVSLKLLSICFDLKSASALAIVKPNVKTITYVSSLKILVTKD
jgi:hypothetical protein